MFPGMNPRKMKQAMKRMGIQQQEIEATEVIIKTADKEIIITNPSVAKVNMMGQENFQISGDIHERELDNSVEINDDDIKTVMDQTDVDAETAKKKLEENDGDIAKTILDLSE